MHCAAHALLNCVAWFSLLGCGNAAKGAPPSEVLSHFARTVGTVLVPSLSAGELQRQQRPGRSPAVDRPTGGIARRQAPPEGANGLAFAAGHGFPYQYERTYRYRYPPYSQHITENFFPGPGFGRNGLPLDSRFFQGQAGPGSRPPPPPPPPPPAALQPEVNKQPSDVGVDAASSGSAKGAGSSDAPVAPSPDPSSDSKSSAQNRPFDNSDFPSGPAGPNRAGFGGDGGFGPGNGNFQVNNRYSALDYERVRQNYYSDPPINQRNNYFSSSFNEIPFGGGGGGGVGGGAGQSFRYTGGLDYDGGGAGGGPGSDFRSGGLGGGGGNLGSGYFNGFNLQGPYQSANYNGGGVDDGSFPGGFDRGSSSFRGPLGVGGLQYPGGGGGAGGFDGAFYPGDLAGGGGGGAGYGGGIDGLGDGDSSLRASSAKGSLARSDEPRAKDRAAVAEKGDGDGDDALEKTGEKGGSSSQD